MLIFENYQQLYDYAEENAKELADILLQPDRRRGWICPICGSGSGKNGTGLTLTKDGIHKGTFTCWRTKSSPCFGKLTPGGQSTGNILDIISAMHGITDRQERDDKFCELFDVKVKNQRLSWDDWINDDVKVDDVKAVKAEPNKKSLLKASQAETPEDPRKEKLLSILKESLEGKEGSVSDLFHKANKQLNNPEAVKYITGRGISADNPFLRYMGYLENHECGIRWGKDKFKGCIAFFGSNSSYGVRDIYPVPPDLSKTMKPSNKDGKHPDIPIGLLEVIKNKDKKLEGTEILEPVFICEGYFDAPSIAEAGADAISLNGTGNINPVIWAFQEWDIKRPLNLVLDNDNGGDQGLDKAIKALNETDIKYYITQFCPKDEDPNDFLNEDRARFISEVQKYKRSPALEFEKTLNRSKRESIKAQLAERGKHAGIRTGFNTLDSASFLDGGLYSGLYVIGAITSLGKTTFALQLADQIAKSGQDVIFFSLEMPELEIMGKSISRYTLKSLLKSGNLKQGERPSAQAKSLYDIYRNYYLDSDGAISRALDNYFDDTGDHLRIIEGIGDKSADDIREEIEKHIKITGNTPVVFIDYLQLLIQPRDKKFGMTDKQITDANIFMLKQISRDFKTPIFGISSFNRDNYNEPVSMKSFKESGAIEYSSDVLIGLEPEYMGIPDASKREQGRLEYKEREDKTGIRSIRLVVLKNRNGRANGVDLFDYYPEFNCYVEKGAAKKNKTSYTGIKIPK